MIRAEIGTVMYFETWNSSNAVAIPANSDTTIPMFATTSATRASDVKRIRELLPDQRS